MLQGALTAVAAKAKEAKAAVGSAVGEIWDAIDNPTYDEHEDDAERRGSRRGSLLDGRLHARTEAGHPRAADRRRRPRRRARRCARPRRARAQNG